MDDSIQRVNGTARASVLAKCFVCYTISFPNILTVASNAFLLMSSKCFTKFQTFQNIITVFERIFLWTQIEILKGAFKKLAWQLVNRQTSQRQLASRRATKMKACKSPQQVSEICGLWVPFPASLTDNMSSFRIREHLTAAGSNRQHWYQLLLCQVYESVVK